MMLNIVAIRKMQAKTNISITYLSEMGMENRSKVYLYNVQGFGGKELTGSIRTNCK